MSNSNIETIEQLLVSSISIIDTIIKSLEIFVGFFTESLTVFTSLLPLFTDNMKIFIIIIPFFIVSNLLLIMYQSL